MKSFKNLIYFLLPLQIIILVLSPRFGWSIHHFPDPTGLIYEGTFYEDGAFHCLYQNHTERVDISYKHPLSKQFTITVNDTDVYNMLVKIDGASVESEPDMLPGIANDIVWQDTFGILFWRLILTVAMTLISIKIFKRANAVSSGESKVLYVGATVLYMISILISLRILF